MRKLILLVAIIALIFFLGIKFYQSKLGPISLTQENPSVVTVTGNQNPQKITIVASGLEIPWALAFLPNKDILFTERTGKLKLISNGQISTVSQIPNVKVYGEGGLMGLTLHPDFNNNHFIYLDYTYSGNGNDTLNRVVRYKYVNNQLTEEKIIVDKIPGAIYHNGGRIKFGPDGFLYITTGDSLTPSLAQNTNSLAGKILRVTDTGSPAPGNPFNNSVYSYGHRNPQGLAWDKDGKLWETEHGRSNPTGYDEVNQIEIGKNYGWPGIQGNETRTGMVSPVIQSGSSTTWAPAGAVFYNDSLFFGGLKGEALYEYKILQKQLVEHLKNRYGRIRDVVLGPDNFLYITTSNKDGRGNSTSDDDRIIKIDPNQL